MLGLSLCALAFLFTLRLFPTAEVAIGHGERMLQANQLARRHLEMQLAKAYTSITPMSGTETVEYGSQRAAKRILEFAYSVDVAPESAGIIRVGVTVEWEYARNKRRVRLEGLRGDFW